MTITITYNGIYAHNGHTVRVKEGDVVEVLDGVMYLNGERV